VQLRASTTSFDVDVVHSPFDIDGMVAPLQVWPLLENNARERVHVLACHGLALEDNTISTIGVINYRNGDWDITHFWVKTYDLSFICRIQQQLICLVFF
jgi:hypothetical protein